MLYTSLQINAIIINNRLIIAYLYLYDTILNNHDTKSKE